MRTWIASTASSAHVGENRVALESRSLACRFARTTASLAVLLLLSSAAAQAQPAETGGEASLRVPDLSTVNFLGMNGHNLLLFGMAIYMRLKNLPVHRAMRDISELIYETCKTYLVTQGKFLMLLWAFI